jgi:hypothetical protein
MKTAIRIRTAFHIQDKSIKLPVLMPPVFHLMTKRVAQKMKKAKFPEMLIFLVHLRRRISETHKTAAITVP